MKIIVPFMNKLIFNGEILSMKRSSLVTWGGRNTKITPECRGIKLSQIEIYPVDNTDCYVVTEETYIKCLTDCLENDNAKRVLGDILSKYNLNTEDPTIEYAYCFDELMKETLVRYIVNN